MSIIHNFDDVINSLNKNTKLNLAIVLSDVTSIKTALPETSTQTR